MNQIKKQDRKHMRLTGYDYSRTGLYYVTICTKNRYPFFGNIKNGEMILKTILKTGYTMIFYIKDMFTRFNS